MSRINDLFDRKKQNVLNIYFTAGFPALNDTHTYIEIAPGCGCRHG